MTGPLPPASIVGSRRDVVPRYLPPNKRVCCRGEVDDSAANPPGPIDPHGAPRSGSTRPILVPAQYPEAFQRFIDETKCLIGLVGAERFELSTPSPPDWCANQAALRSDFRAAMHDNADQPKNDR